MATIENLSRRTFLKGAGGAGGFVLGIKLRPDRALLRGRAERSSRRSRPTCSSRSTRAAP